MRVSVINLIQMHGDLTQPVDGLVNPGGRIFQPCNSFRGSGDFLDLPKVIHEHQTTLHAQLTSQQVHRLDPVGSLINGGNLTVPEELFHWIITGIAVSAMIFSSNYPAHDLYFPSGSCESGVLPGLPEEKIFKI